VLASGSAREHIVAYTRGDDVLVAVSRWTVRLGEAGWGDTVLLLPDGQWTDVLTDRQRKGSVSATELFDDLPVVLLERADV
jgi:(1->4)-alpha-D-glucan 1-alpha-D-glucosylmutase